MATMPSVTNREPWDLAQAFIQELNRNAASNQQATRQLDMIPVEEIIRQRQMELQQKLGLESYGKQLEMSEPYKIGAEGRANSEFDRRQTVTTDQNIRQLDEADENKVERDRKLYEAYPEYWKSKNARSSGRTGTRISTDITEGGNVMMAADPMEVMTAEEDANWEKVGTGPHPKTGKTVTIFKKKGYTLGSQATPSQGAGTQPQVAAPPAPLPNSEGGGSGKGNRGVPDPTIGPAVRQEFDPDMNAAREKLKQGLPKQQSQNEDTNFSVGDLGFKPLRTVEDAPTRFAELFLKYGKQHGVHPDLIAATAFQESRFKASPTSPAGAQGLMQIMPGTAKELGVNPWNPEQAVDGGVRYLAQGLEQYDGNVGLALARYNAGPGGVQRFLKTGRLPTETREYVKSITGYSIEDWVKGRVPKAEQQEVNAKPSGDEDDPLFWVA